MKLLVHSGWEGSVIISSMITVSLAHELKVHAPDGFTQIKLLEFPPSTERDSTNATLHPCLVAAAATHKPDTPPPITTTSYFFFIIASGHDIHLVGNISWRAY